MENKCNVTDIESLVKEGILYEDGTPNTLKINLVSGAISSPLIVDNLYNLVYDDINTIARLNHILNSLYDKDIATAIEVVRLIFDICTLAIPKEVEMIFTHEKASEQFIGELIDDIEDLMGDLAVS